ncbi:MAG: P22 coat protein [Clostridia bacterium]|nr:P22 coat protein [Clostridia bacterium]
MNNFLTTKTIAREALPILESNLVFPALIYKDFSGDFSKQGDTIQVRKPPVYSADEFSGSINVQDINEGEVAVRLDKIADVSVELSAKEMALNAEDFTKQVIEPAMVAIAEKINADGLALYKDVPYVCGKAGTTPSTLADLAGGAKVLNDNKAPLVGRGAVWNTEAIANFQVLPALVNAEKCGSTDALREGSIGRVFGVDHYFSQQVPAHVAGDFAAENATAKTVEGNKILLEGTVSGSLNKGDLLIIGNGTYTVSEAAVLSETENRVSVFPALAAEDENGSVSPVGDHAANMMFQRNAFGFVTRPLEEARGADSYVTTYNGLSLRVTMDYNIATKKQTLSIDTLYGFKTLYPELAVRVLG